MTNPDNKYYYWLYCADKQFCRAINVLDDLIEAYPLNTQDLLEARNKAHEAAACLEYVRQLLGYQIKSDAKWYEDRHNQPNLVHAIDTFVTNMENGSDAV